jgi:hypothetical protein
MTPTQVAEIRSQLAMLQKRMAKLESESKREAKPLQMPLGRSFIVGETLQGAGKVFVNPNELVRKVCEIIRETGKPCMCSEWYVEGVASYNHLGAMTGIEIKEPRKEHTRTISVAEANAYWDGEKNELLRKVFNHDPKGYKYKRTSVSLTKRGEVKKYMRVRGR